MGKIVANCRRDCRHEAKRDKKQASSLSLIRDVKLATDLPGLFSFVSAAVIGNKRLHRFSQPLHCCSVIGVMAALRGRFMRYQCSSSTDLVDLFGREENSVDGFRFRCGPISQAMKNGEELILENSAALSQITLAKISMLVHHLFVVETEEQIEPGKGFRLILA